MKSPRTVARGHQRDVPDGMKSLQVYGNRTDFVQISDMDSNQARSYPMYVVPMMYLLFCKIL